VVFFPSYENGKPVKERDQYLKLLQEKAKSPADLIHAEIIAMDPLRDLALIRVPKLPPGTEALPIAKGVVNIGQVVHSVGNPGASDATWVYTQGVGRSVYRKKWSSTAGRVQAPHDAEIRQARCPTKPRARGL